MRRIEYLIQFADLFRYKEIYDPLGNQYIVFENSQLTAIHMIEDKTAFEAVENHIHLFERINRIEFENLIPVAQKLGPAILNNLKTQYPEKCFYVYVTLSLGDSMIIRFHQKWEGEMPYYDSSSNFSETERVFEFSK